MANLRNLTSIFEIGFTIHFLFPLLEEMRQRAVARQSARIRELNETAGAEMETWTTFKGHVSYAFSDLRSVTLLCSGLSFVVAIFSLGVLLYVGFNPGDTVTVSDSIAGILIGIALLPLAVFVLIIEIRARHLEVYLDDHHRLFAWITAMHGPTRQPSNSADQEGGSA